MYDCHGIMCKGACSVSGNMTVSQPVDPRSIRGMHICFFVKSIVGKWSSYCAHNAKSLVQFRPMLFNIHCIVIVVRKGHFYFM